MMEERCHLVLSTCKSDRYRDNLLIALAMPSGTRLQYRYAQQHIDTGIVEQILPTKRTADMVQRVAPRNGIVGASVILGYLVDEEPVSVIPCRFARIIAAEPYGSHIVLQLELREFACTANENELTKALRAHGGIPSEPAFGPEHVQSLWIQVPTSVLNSHVRRTDSLAEWETIVEQLSPKPEFKEVTVYYTITEIVDEGGDSPRLRMGKRRTAAEPIALTPREGRFHLRPSHFYEVRLYHYTPEGIRSENGMSVWGEFGFETQDPPIQVLTNPVQRIDSPYDVKKYRFKTRRSSRKEYSRISIYRTLLSGNRRTWDFDLDLVLRTAWVETAAVGFLAGLLVAIPSVIAILNTAGETQGVADPVLIGLTLLAGAVAGVVAAFGLKPPL